jgi:hypothetical protein
VITKGLVNPAGIAIDRSGNLYVGTGYRASQMNVEVYARGSKSPSRTITDGVTSPAGLAVDANGMLYVANTYQDNVEEYRSGQDDPFQTITEAVNKPTGVTVDKKGMLYVDNAGNSTVIEFALGSLKPLKRQISKGLFGNDGIAYYPHYCPSRAPLPLWFPDPYSTSTHRPRPRIATRCQNAIRHIAFSTLPGFCKCECKTRATNKPRDAMRQPLIL